MTLIECLDFLVKDENEAVDGYDKAIKAFNEAELPAADREHIVAELQHIKEEELEHIRELKSLAKMVPGDWSPEDGPKAEGGTEAVEEDVAVRIPKDKLKDPVSVDLRKIAKDASASERYDAVSEWLKAEADALGRVSAEPASVGDYAVSLVGGIPEEAAGTGYDRLAKSASDILMHVANEGVLLGNLDDDFVNGINYMCTCVDTFSEGSISSNALASAAKRHVRGNEALSEVIGFVKESFVGMADYAAGNPGEDVDSGYEANYIGSWMGDYGDSYGRWPSQDANDLLMNGAVSAADVREFVKRHYGLDGLVGYNHGENDWVDLTVYGDGEFDISNLTPDEVLKLEGIDSDCDVWEALADEYSSQLERIRSEEDGRIEDE